MKTCRKWLPYGLLVISAGLAGCESSSKDVPPPSGLAVHDATVGEGNSGTANNLAFPVVLRRAEGNNSTVRVNFATTPGTAIAGDDFNSVSGSLTFNPGENAKTITVPVQGDTLDEGNETLGVSLSGASNAPIVVGSAIGTIVDDEAAPVLSIADAAITEGDSGSTLLNFAVSLSRPSSQPVTAGFATGDGSATADSDYTAQSGVLTLTPGQTQQTIAVAVIGDIELENDETLSVTLATPTNAGLGRAVATGIISDDEPLPDTTPNDFTFSDKSGVTVSTVQMSNTVTIGGINQPAPISVSGGEYSIGCSASFTAGNGTINNDQSVCVRHTASANPGTKVDTALNVGGVTDTFSSTTATPAPDTTPNQFSFDDRTNVAPGTVQVSNAVTISGINQPASVSVTGGQYSIGCGATFTGSSGTVSNGDTVCVRHTSSASASTQVSTTLTVGGVSDIFSTTTAAPAADTTPNPFSFNNQSGVAPGTEQVSNAVTISGINQPADISVSGGQYSIGCGASFTSGPGTISNGDSVCVRHTSAAGFDETADTTLTVGGVSDTFTTTTATPAPDTTPDSFSFNDETGVAAGTEQRSNSVTISGINQPAGISVSGDGGEYSVGCTEAGFTTGANTVSDGDTVCVRHTASPDPDTTVTTTLTVGGVSADFNSTTAAAAP